MCNLIIEMSTNCKVTIKKPKAIVLELTGALVTRQWMSYSEQRRNNVKKNIGLYFAENYPRNKELRLDINFFKLQEANEIKERIFNENCPKINDGSKKLPLPDVAINHIVWRLDNDPGCGALTLFLLHYSEWAYKKNLIITPVYDEVKEVLETWKNLNINIFVDVASAHFVNMILDSTTQGSLIPYFSGHMNLIQFNGQKTIRDFNLLPTMLYMEPADIVFVTRFPGDARTASELGITTFLLIREDFHPEFKTLIKKAEELKNNTKKEPPANDLKITNKKSSEKSLTDVSAYKSGLFTITSKINQLSKLGGSQAIEEEQKKKLMTMFDSFEDPNSLQMNANSKSSGSSPDNSTNKKESETDIRPSPSTISANDLANIKYILSLSDIQFK